MSKNTNSIDQEKIRKGRNAYAKAWRDKNKDKVKQYQENYFKKLADKLGL